MNADINENTDNTSNRFSNIMSNPRTHAGFLAIMFSSATFTNMPFALYLFMIISSAALSMSIVSGVIDEIKKG